MDSVLEFVIRSRNCGRFQDGLDELPNLLKALGRMLAIVRHNVDADAVPKINLDDFFAALGVP